MSNVNQQGEKRSSQEDKEMHRNAGGRPGAPHAPGSDQQVGSNGGGSSQQTGGKPETGGKDARRPPSGQDPDKRQTGNYGDDLRKARDDDQKGQRS